MMHKKLLIGFTVFFSVSVFAQSKNETVLHALLSKVAVAKFDDFKTHALALKKDSSAKLLFAKEEAYESFKIVKNFNNKAYKYMAFFDVEYDKVDFTVNNFERMLSSTGRERFFPKLKFIEQDSSLFTFIMQQENSEYYNAEVDEYTFKLLYDSATQKHKCSVELYITNAQYLIPFYNDSHIVYKLKPLVSANQFVKSSYQKKKDKNGYYTVYAGTNNDNFIRIEIDKDEATKQKQTKLKGKFKFVLSRYDHFYLRDLKELFKYCFNDSTADVVIDESDIPTDTSKFEDAYGRIVQLSTSSYTITKNYFRVHIDYEDEEDFKKTFTELTIDFTFFDDQGKKDKTYHWAKTSNNVDEKLQQSLDVLCKEAKNRSTYNQDKSDEVLNDTLLLNVINSDFTLLYIKQTEVQGFTILRADESNVIYLVKKLSGNVEADNHIIQNLVYQIGNALPRNFVFSRDFYTRYQPLDNFKNQIKSGTEFNENIFSEMYNYKFERDALLNISFEKKIHTLPDYTEKTYLIIRIEKS